MIQLIIGEKGRGKTKILLDKVNTEIKEATGNVVYLDKSKQHMYEINNKVRLIDVTDFPVKDKSGFLGFICGMISKDRDLELVYLDSFLKLANISEEEVGDTIAEIEKLSDKFNVRFVISISTTRANIPEAMHRYIINE